MGKWQFEQLRGAPKRNPQEAELFKNKDADEGEYAGNDYLVREVIQNALDARSPNSTEPIRVRFAIHDASEGPNAKQLETYFARLREPLQTFDIACDQHGIPRLYGRFLVCEDFGTRGLEGDESLYTDPAKEDKSRQDFYWFWRNIGRSAKTNEDLGRWGLGKTVFRAVSRIRCMLGLTVRESDGRRLLMGQAVLQPHRHGAHEYQPEGYWCDDGHDDFPQPIQDKDEIEQFRRDWRLTRTNEPGLSMVSPYVPNELNERRILRAVVVNFFVRILRGELVVEVAGPSLETVRLDALSIDEVCRGLDWGGDRRYKLQAAPPLDFVRRCLAEKALIPTQVLGTRVMPSFGEGGGFDDAKLKQLQQQFAFGDLIPVKVRISLPRNSGEPEIGELDVYLQRLEDGAHQESYFVREGMTITRRNSRASKRGIQAFVNVESGPMARLLGDTEGPAHEDWEKQAERPDREWRKWKGRVEFVRHIVDHLVEYLTPKQTEPDFDLLADFFSMEVDDGNKASWKSGDKNKGKPSNTFPTPKPKWYLITPRADGFSILRNLDVPMPEYAELEIEMAYDLPSGNAMSKWSPIDFDISQGDQIRLTGKAVTPHKIKGNKLRLEIEDDQFRFSATGFDQYRDLLVDVREVHVAEEVLS